MIRRAFIFVNPLKPSALRSPPKKLSRNPALISLVSVDGHVHLPYNAIQCPFTGGSYVCCVTVNYLHGYLCFTKGVIQMATENKMGVMPLNRLLISMSVPMMISMLVQALYNIVDSMFVAQLSENALTAVSLAFPAQNLMIAVATGTGVGVNAALSRNLGEKNFERANRIADHALFLAAMSYIAFALFGLFFARQFFRLQTDIEEIVDLGTTY